MSNRSVARKRPFVPPEAPKTKKSQATRVRVLGVAADLFVEHGYHAVSLRDIAEKAGLTHGGIYGHFGSKGQLLVEVIRWKLAEQEHSPEFAAAVDDPDRSAGLLVEASRRDVRLLGVDAAAAARHDPEVARGMADLLEERHAAIRDALVDDVGDADSTAGIVAILEAGIAANEAIGVTHLDFEKIVPALRSLLVSLFDQSS